MTARDLEAFEFPRLANVTLAVPDQITFRDGTGSSTIESFGLNDAALRGCRGVEAVMTWHKKAYRPCQLKMFDNGYDTTLRVP
eukprot:7003863-Pyramimonas_sp.AAC.1